jgi:hypothetical protein
VRKDCRVSVFSDSRASGLFIIMQENYDSRVLTNGRGWIFIILTLDDKVGGTYLQSPKILAYNTQNFTEELSKDAVSLISSIIAHWVGLAACSPGLLLILLSPGIR